MFDRAGILRARLGNGGSAQRLGDVEIGIRGWRPTEGILKSGCKVEELQHHSAERLERAIAIKMVVGWRIQLMVRLGREVPEMPAELLFSDVELRDEYG